MPGKAAAPCWGFRFAGVRHFISTPIYFHSPRLGPASADLGKVQAGLFHLGPPRGMSSRSGLAVLGFRIAVARHFFPLRFIFPLRVLAPHAPHRGAARTPAVLYGGPRIYSDGVDSNRLPPEP